MAIERRGAERKRRIGDRLFQAIFMAMDEGAVSRNGNGEIVAVNPAAENILGLAASDLIGRSSADFARAFNFIREDETPFPWELDPATLARQTGKPQRNMLMGAHRPDGTLVWISVNAQPLLSDGGSGPNGVVTTFRDVSEHKRAEDALSFVAQRGWMASKEKFFDALVQYLGKTLGVDYVIVSRLTEAPGIAETVALYAKGAIVPNLRYSLKGTPCENVMGNKFCFYPQGIQQTFPEDALLVEIEASSYAGLPLWDSTGQPLGLIAALDSKPLRNEAQVSQILQFMATRAAAELERERNDRMLRRNEREFRSLAENMPDNVIRYDLQARVQYANPALTNSIAPEFLPVLGEAVTQTYPGNEGAAWCERVVEQVIATGAPAEVEFEMANPQGELRLNHVRFVAERDEHGEIVGALGIGRDITEQRASERRLRQALEFTEGVINAIPDLLFEADRNGTCLNVWARTPELLAVHKEALLGKRFSDVVTPDTAEVALAALREADEKGLSFGKVLRVDIPQGERWFELSVSKKPGGDMPGRFIVLSRDVTGRKRMEDDIRRRELEFRSLAENMPDNVIRYDRQARVLYMNPAMMDTLAPEVRPVLGQSPIETYPGNDAVAGYQRVVEQVIATGTPAEWEFQIPSSHGEMRFHQVRYVAEHDSNGEIVGVLGLGRDITERKRMEDDIRRRELEFRSLAENMPDNVVRYDRQARAVYMNPAIMANVAPDVQPVLGQSPMEAYPGIEEAAGHQRIVEQVIETGMPAEWEFQTLDSCGEIRIHHARYVAERDANGEIVGVLTIGRDITERKLAEEYEQFRSHTLDLLSGGAPLPAILEGIVRGVEQLKPDMICSILLLDKQGKKLGEGVAPSLPDFYNAAVDGLEIGVGVGCCGTVAATGERVIANDIMTHPYWAHFKELAAKAGLAACWSEPIRASSGKVLGTFAVYHRRAHSPAPFDIALIEKSTHLVSIAIERRRAEEALRASEREFRTLAENLPDPLVRYDREGRRTYVSPVLERAFAVTAESMLGVKARETNPTAMPMRETYVRALERTLATGERTEFEMHIASPDGNMRTHLCFMVAERGSDGQITGAIAVSRDITEQKGTEARLALQARRAEVLLELPDASEAMDEVAFMQRGQELSEELTGSSISFIHFVNEGEDSIDLVTWSRRTLEHYCRASFNKHYPTSQAGIWADALRQRRPVVFNDYAAYPHRRGLPEGHAELTRLISLPVIENGKVVMLAGVGNKPADYTDLDVETVQLIANEIWRTVQRKRTDKQLEEHRCHLERLVESRTQALSTAKEAAEVANRAKSHFLAAASHDLRQPLQAIRLFYDTLTRTRLSEEQKRISRYFSKSVNSLNELLNGLLDISRLDAGIIEPQPAVIQAEELLGIIGAEFDTLAREKNLSLNLFCPRQGMALFSDENLLLTLLRNLVSNAVKYTKRGGILVGIRRRGDCALIQVWDTGFGIPAELRDSIFEEYFQIGNPERDRAKGVGLGLAIVRRLSTLLGIGVRLYSREGKGSVFEVTVPLALGSDMPASPLPAGATPETVAPSRLAGKRIVVIEDDGTAGEALKLALEMEGALVSLFDTPAGALGSAEVMGADYYISDYRLPGMNGLQLLNAIQETSAEPIKAVLLTGNTSPDQVAMMQSFRCKVLFKPIALPKLLSALNAHEAAY